MARARASRILPLAREHAGAALRSLAEDEPELSREWHPWKNGDLTPRDVKRTSRRRVWWKCAEGPDHEWQAPVAKRAVLGASCPACDGRQVSATSSLAHVAPDVAAQWHPTRNGHTTPEQVLSTEHKLRWWSCPAGRDHVWRERTNARLARADGCPFCAGRRASRTSSLAARSPRLAREWHPRKNGRVTPRDVVPASTSQFWWKCPEGPDHEWRATVAQRAIWGSRCPFCHGKRASRTNALSFLAPRIAAEWHPTKNGELTPADVKVDSLRSVWWRCAAGHAWRRRIEHRTKRGVRCPICARS